MYVFHPLLVRSQASVCQLQGPSTGMCLGLCSFSKAAGNIHIQAYTSILRSTCIHILYILAMQYRIPFWFLLVLKFSYENFSLCHMATICMDSTLTVFPTHMQMVLKLVHYRGGSLPTVLTCPSICLISLVDQLSFRDLTIFTFFVRLLYQEASLKTLT